MNFTKLYFPKFQLYFSIYYWCFWRVLVSFSRWNDNLSYTTISFTKLDDIKFCHLLLDWLLSFYIHVSVPKQKRETNTHWEINEEDEGTEETEVGKTKRKKKKCKVETIQRRGGKTELRERRWILKFGGEKSQFSKVFFLVSFGIYFQAKTRYLSRYGRNGSGIVGI